MPKSLIDIDEHLLTEAQRILGTTTKKATAAPRGALLYSQFSWEEFGGIFLDLMAYLNPKGPLGDNSMPLKQRSCPGTGAGCCGIRAIW
jgi:Uncharacterized protein conserved in bacteria (DUF2191).